MTKLALIGLGGIAQSVHLPVIQRNRSIVELEAVVDLSAQRRSRFGSVYAAAQAFASVADLCEAISSGDVHIDVAILATGGLHTNDALRLIRAGVRVLVEKPLAYSHAELDRLEQGILELGRSPEQWLRVGYMKEHDPAVAAALPLLAEVSPRAVRVEVLHPADAKQLAFAKLTPPAMDIPEDVLAPAREAFLTEIHAAIGEQPDWLRNLYTNVVLGSIVHDLALTRHLGFELATVEFAVRRGEGFPGSVQAVGRTRDDIPWLLDWHFVEDFPEYRETIVVLHEQGQLSIEFGTPYVLNAPTVLEDWHSAPNAESVRSRRTWPQEEAFERELHSLVGMVRDEFSTGSSIAAARRDLRSAQELWMACAHTAGSTVDPACEAARET